LRTNSLARARQETLRFGGHFGQFLWDACRELTRQAPQSLRYFRRGEAREIRCGPGPRLQGAAIRRVRHQPQGCCGHRSDSTNRRNYQGRAHLWSVLVLNLREVDSLGVLPVGPEWVSLRPHWLLTV